MMFKTMRMVMLALLVLAPTLARADAEPAIPVLQPVVEQGEQPVKPEPASAIDPSLSGKPWRLEELVGEPAADVQAEPYLMLTNSGELIGFGGCNYFIGKYRTDAEGKIVVSSLRASHQQCPESSPREATLLTSLVMANTLEIVDQELTFFMNSSCLMKFRVAPDVSVAELLQQGQRVKTEAHKKSRGKKKKITAKARKHRKKSASKTPAKPHKAATTPAKAK